MENVTVQRNAFLFCRYSVAILVWVALFVGGVRIYLLGAVFVIMALSALLKVHRAPMVWLYTKTLGRFIKSKDVVLDVRAMRVAHGLGALLALISMSLVWRDHPFAVYVVAGFALLKSASAVGLCPAYKLYGCVTKGGGCCALTGKR
ncbi:MAG: DUF4395 family protein [Coriobacteriia bacterium]